MHEANFVYRFMPEWATGISGRANHASLSKDGPNVAIKGNLSLECCNRRNTQLPNRPHRFKREKCGSSEQEPKLNDDFRCLCFHDNGCGIFAGNVSAAYLQCFEEGSCNHRSTKMNRLGWRWIRSPPSSLRAEGAVKISGAAPQRYLHKFFPLARRFTAG